MVLYKCLNGTLTTFKWGIFMLFNTKNLIVIFAALIAGTSLQADSQNYDPFKERVFEIVEEFITHDDKYCDCLVSCDDLNISKKEFSEKVKAYFVHSNLLKFLLNELEQDYVYYTNYIRGIAQVVYEHDAKINNLIEKQ